MITFLWIFLSFVVAPLCLAWWLWQRSKKPLKNAIAIVANIAIKPLHLKALVHWAAYAEAYNQVRDVLRTKEHWHWLQQQVDEKLRELADTFNNECKLQEKERENLRNLEKTKVGTMDASDVTSIEHSMMRTATFVSNAKQDFWALHNAAQTIGLKTWKEMAFYRLLAPTDPVAYPK